MFKPRFAVVIAIALLCQPAFADQVSLKNGDRLTGKIVKADGKALVIKTEFAGEVTLVWDAITSITSDTPLHLSLADGRTVSGLVSTSGDQVEIKAADAGAVTTTKGAITGLRSDDEQAAYDRLQNPGFFDQWNGGLNAGLALARGNTDTTNFALGFAASRTTVHDKIGVYAASLYSKDSSDGVSRTTANVLRGGARYDYNLTDRWFLNAFTDLEHNELQDLDLRFVLGGGAGYHAIRTERTELDVFGGIAWNRENFAHGEDRSSAEALVGQSLSYRLGPRTSIKEQFVLFPNLTDTGNYRMNFDTTMATDITHRIGWQFTISDRYLSNPPLGFERNDLLLTTGITVKLGH
jgi:putative salt-induced outer membrane protein